MANTKCICGHWRSQHQDMFLHRSWCRAMETDPYKNPQALECNCSGFMEALAARKAGGGELRRVLLLVLLTLATKATNQEYTPIPMVDRALIQIDEAFGDPPPGNWEARYDAWLKTPAGREEMKVWRKLESK